MSKDEPIDFPNVSLDVGSVALAISADSPRRSVESTPPSLSVSRPTTRLAAPSTSPDRYPSTCSPTICASAPDTSLNCRPVRSSDAMSACPSSGFDGERRSTLNVSGVPLSVSSMSMPPARVCDSILRSGSIVLGLAKSMVPDSIVYRLLPMKSSPPSRSVARPDSAGAAAVPITRRSPPSCSRARLLSTMTSLSVSTRTFSCSRSAKPGSRAAAMASRSVRSAASTSLTTAIGSRYALRTIVTVPLSVPAKSSTGCCDNARLRSALISLRSPSGNSRPMPAIVAAIAPATPLRRP